MDFIEKITNKEEMQKSLIIASLFIMVYENFISAWEDNFLSFFGDYQNINGEWEWNFFKRVKDGPGFDEFHYEYDKEELNKFNKKIYKRIASKKGAYIKDLSMFDFMVEYGFLTKDEYDDLVLIKDLRNKFAHNLDEIITVKGLPDNTNELLEKLLNIRCNSSFRWIRDVEMTIDPDSFQYDENGNIIEPEAAYTNHDIIMNIIKETVLN